MNNPTNRGHPSQAVGDERFYIGLDGDIAPAHGYLCPGLDPFVDELSNLVGYYSTPGNQGNVASPIGHHPSRHTPAETASATD